MPTTNPDEESIANGPRYLTSHDRTSASGGRIVDQHGEIRWRYGMRPSSLGTSWHNPFNKGDFVLINDDGCDVVKIRRTSFVPPVFEVLTAGRVIGRIRLISFLRNKYEIALGEQRWILWIRLFNVIAHVDSSERTDVWIAGGPWDWHMLLRPGIESEPLLCAIAFIHWEYLNYS